MLPYAVVVVVVAFARASRARWPDDVVPGTSVLEEGSGLTDVAADGNRTVATVTGGLDDALTTMNFHRYVSIYGRRSSDSVVFHASVPLI